MALIKVTNHKPDLPSVIRITTFGNTKTIKIKK